MSKDANSFGHDKALAWKVGALFIQKKRMHRFDTPSFLLCVIQGYSVNVPIKYNGI